MVGSRDPPLGLGPLTGSATSHRTPSLLPARCGNVRLKSGCSHAATTLRPARTRARIGRGLAATISRTHRAGFHTSRLTSLSSTSMPDHPKPMSTS